MPGTTIYEEGSKGPLTIHDPNRFQDGERVEGLSSQIDVLLTVLGLLGYEKPIRYYGNRRDEIFDLSEDASEQNDLAGEYSQEELNQRRDELLEWSSNVNATYTLTGG